MPMPRPTFAHFGTGARWASTVFEKKMPKLPTPSPSVNQCRAIKTRSSLKIVPIFIRIPLLCRTSQSPLHSLMRNLIPVPPSSSPGGAHVSIF